jgi:hypothetical protein
MTREDFKGIYPDLAEAARSINEYKASLKGSNKDVSFEQNLQYVKDVLKGLFGVNDEKLVNLLAYDAYQFFINSDGEVIAEYSVDGDGYRDIKLTDGGNSFYLTQAHYTDAPFYGSFHVTYADGVQRDYRFDADNNALILNGNVITPENISAEVLGADSVILEYSSSSVR